MANKYGRLSVTFTSNDPDAGSSSWTQVYAFYEVNNGDHKVTFVGQDEWDVQLSQAYVDLDYTNTTELDAVFAEGYETTYNWIVPMTDVDADSGIEFPISIANGGTGATTAAQALTNLGAAAVDHAHGNTVLWSGGSYMGSSHVINLPQNVSEQDHGIILVFSGYDITNNTPLNSSWTTHFVPKEMVQYNNGGGQTFLMAINSAMSDFGSKYLYIEDNKILGHISNTQTGTGASGITFSNNKYVLRYVIGF